MSDISFLAIPNIAGLRLAWFLKVFGLAVLFGVSLFFVLFFWYLHHKRKVLSHTFEHIDQQSRAIEKHLLKEKISISSGKIKLVLFIEYLERFVTNTPYATLSHILIAQGCTQQEAEELSEVLYANKKISQQLEDKIDTLMLSVKR